MADLRSSERHLFSEGVRDNHLPAERDENSYAFLDRVRQPSFERERRWWEDSFEAYPEGDDKMDLRARFKSSMNEQHRAAGWELCVHRLWTDFGWQLTPHPDTGTSRFRDFLAERGDQSHYLECTVAGRPEDQVAADKRATPVRQILDSLPRNRDFAVRLQIDGIGSEPLNVRSVKDQLIRALEALDPRVPLNTPLVSMTTPDGWVFAFYAEPQLAGLGTTESFFEISGPEQHLEAIRSPLAKKLKGASSLGKPYLVALVFGARLRSMSARSPETIRAALCGVGEQDPSAAFTNPSLSGVLISTDYAPGWSLPQLYVNKRARNPLDDSQYPEQLATFVCDGIHIAEARQGTTPEAVFGWDWADDPLPFHGVSDDPRPIPEPQGWSPIS